MLKMLATNWNVANYRCSKTRIPWTIFAKIQYFFAHEKTQTLQSEFVSCQTRSNLLLSHQKFMKALVFDGVGVGWVLNKGDMMKL